ncbi:hypothetical protein Mgra_00005943 [Meloidogyne graminicola]|uniref:CUB domain-containing protein n=1 Tax=Meloidogyne graminicola TaxID=189291 RepID=A0A8S9ZNE8_9BILA|nr:hypothetical protein Mgra_00005943 [Meloidogyne graminicola]
MSFISSHRHIDAEYRSIKSDCGGAFLANTEWTEISFISERTLKRINQKHKRCRWFLYTAQQQPLEIIFEQFSFPSTNGNCMDEFIEIRDVGSISQCQHPACSKEQLNTKMKNNTYMW